MTQLTMYTTVWCGYCRRLKAQLHRAGIGFREVDIENDADAAVFVAGINGGNQTVPTVVLPDGSAMSNPTVDQIVHALAADQVSVGCGTIAGDDSGDTRQGSTTPPILAS